MNKHLEGLVKLSKYDKQISMFEPEIQKEEEKLSEFENKALKLKKSFDDASNFIEDVRSKKSKNNIHLGELKTKLDGISKKQGAIKTEKELKALQLEDEIAKEQISFVNEELIRLDKLMNLKQGELEEFEEKLNKEEENIKETKATVDKEIGKIKSLRNKVSESRGLLLEKFDNKLLVFYEKIRRWAKDTSVVPVIDQACYGCYMKISDKSYAEVIKADEIVNCSHCGRILYKEVETKEE